MIPVRFPVNWPRKMVWHLPDLVHPTLLFHPMFLYISPSLLHGQVTPREKLKTRNTGITVFREMKYGLQVINSWSARHNVSNNSLFLLELIAEADKAGWDGVFLWDHLLFPWVIEVAEPWTILAAASSITEDIKLGTAVTPVTRRRPQVLAKQLVTLDELSGGRVILGAGLGGTGKNDAGRDFTAFGEPCDYSTLSEVGDEALQIITGLWTGEEFSYNGKHHKVDKVTFQPGPVQIPRIPIWIGGVSRAAVRRAAKYDGWVAGGPCPTVNEPGLSLEETARGVKKISESRRSSDHYDVCYGFEFPKDSQELLKWIEGGEEAGVTWMHEMIFGLKYDGRGALDRVRSGPPKY